MQTTVSLAPLQGYTDWIFRKAYAKYIGNVDKYYTPYIVLQNKGNLKKSHQREVEQPKEREINLTPQILCGTSSEFKTLASYLQKSGYTKINWNLGCPYPMITRKMRGAGLLPHPDLIHKILEENLENFSISLSVKMRLGYESNDEIFKVLEVLNKFPLEEVIIHPRVGKQLYKGEVDLINFEECINKSVHPIAYNGDILTVTDYNTLAERFPTVKHWMIGRGILKDFWLPAKIKRESLDEKDELLVKFKAFHDEIYQNYAEILNGDTHLLMKIKPFWEYFAHHFKEPKKVYKAIKKASNIKKYNEAVTFAFSKYNEE